MLRPALPTSLPLFFICPEGLSLFCCAIAHSGERAKESAIAGMRGDATIVTTRSRDDRYNRNNVYRNDGYRNNGSYYPNRGYGNGGYNGGYQMERNQGYQAGVNTGASDAQRGQSYSPQRSHYYRDASSQQFRNAFVQGYDVGYRQYGGYNNNGGYRRGNSSSILGRILGGR